MKCKVGMKHCEFSGSWVVKTVDELFDRKAFDDSSL